jgi:hypothetical protein
MGFLPHLLSVWAKLPFRSVCSTGARHGHMREPARFCNRNVILTHPPTAVTNALARVVDAYAGLRIQPVPQWRVLRSGMGFDGSVYR